MNTEEQTGSATPASASFDPTATNLLLLEQTQAYLQLLLDHRAPDSLLTQAWQEFYRVYSALIRRFIVARGLRSADVDDCLQEVWLAVAAKLADFERPRDRPGLRAWLYSVVRSKTADILRRSARHPAQPLDLAIEKGAEPASREPDPAAELEQQWDTAMVETAMEELRQLTSPTTYEVLRLRLLEGRSEEETAAALHLTPEQVRYRKHRAQQKLRTILAVFTGEPLER